MNYCEYHQNFDIGFITLEGSESLEPDFGIIEVCDMPLLVNHLSHGEYLTKSLWYVASFQYW